MPSSPSKTILRIPKDPRSANNIFLVDIPLALAARIEPGEWQEYISGLNNIILKKEKASVWSFVRLLLIIPSLVVLDSYDQEIGDYIESINDKIRQKDVHIENPCSNGLIELVVVISGKSS